MRQERANGASESNNELWVGTERLTSWGFGEVRERSAAAAG